MIAEMVPITVAELKSRVQGWKDANTIITAATLVDPLLMAKIGDEVLGFVAFIPQTLVSDIAYVWIQLTPAASYNKHAIARLAKRWLPAIHSRYPRLVGHCVGSCSSVAWLESLGAKWGEIDNTLIRFTIEATNG